VQEGSEGARGTVASSIAVVGYGGGGGGGLVARNL